MSLLTHVARGPLPLTTEGWAGPGPVITAMRTLTEPFFLHLRSTPLVHRISGSQDTCVGSSCGCHSATFQISQEEGYILPGVVTRIFFFFYFVLIQGVQSGDFWVPSHGRYPLYILTSAQGIPATRIQGRKSTRQYQGSLGGSLERLLQGADVIWQIS